MRLLRHEPEKVRGVLRRASKLLSIVLFGRGGYLCAAGRTTLGEGIRAAEIAVVCGCMQKNPNWAFPKSVLVPPFVGTAHG